MPQLYSILSLRQHSSFSLIQAPQLIDFLQDFDLEILDHLSGHFWALDKALYSAGIVVNGQRLVDFGNNLVCRIALEHGHSDVVEDWVLKALLRRWSEERVVLEHVEDELDQVRRALLEHIVTAFFELPGLLRADFHLIVVNVFVRDEGEVLLVELAKPLVNDYDLVVAAHDVGLR